MLFILFIICFILTLIFNWTHLFTRPYDLILRLVLSKISLLSIYWINLLIFCYRKALTLSWLHLHWISLDCPRSYCSLQILIATKWRIYLALMIYLVLIAKISLLLSLKVLLTLPLLHLSIQIMITLCILTHKRLSTLRNTIILLGLIIPHVLHVLHCKERLSLLLRNLVS